jgi:hypothetical protein
VDVRVCDAAVWYWTGDGAGVYRSKSASCSQPLSTAMAQIMMACRPEH